MMSWVGKISSGKYRVSFERVIKSGRGILLSTKTEKLIEYKKRVRYTMKEFHNMFGYPNNHMCNMTAKN